MNFGDCWNCSKRQYVIDETHYTPPDYKPDYTFGCSDVNLEWCKKLSVHRNVKLRQGPPGHVGSDGLA